MGMYYDIDTYLYSDGSRPYDAASGRYFTSSSLSSGVNFVYSFAGNTPVDRTTAAVNHDRNSTVPSFGSVFVEQFGNNIDPRVFGFAQAAFGISEMLVGTAFAWTGVGLVVAANGADDTWAGIATMYYGEHVHTLKYRALYAATGSEMVATIGEIGAGLASGDAVSRLNHLAKHAQQASNVGEAVVRTADNAVETLANSADNFAVSAATQSPVRRFELPTIQSWCFAPDTLVDTPQGKRRIDEIHENDLVFAFDFTSGQWVERPVEVCHRNLYQGSLIEISTKHGTVVATAYHPFWVLEGHDLANRPRPRKLADTEDEGLALRGRWVNSHNLMAGDLIYSTEGRELRVLKIVQTYEEQFEVCNLTIAQNHSFAVGNDGVLVHNTGGCGDAARVGGLGYPGSMPGAAVSKLTPMDELHNAANFARYKAELAKLEAAQTDTATVLIRRPARGATAAQDAQIREYVAIANLSIVEGFMSATGRVSTEGSLRAAANRAAAAEWRRAKKAGTPYRGVVGHGPDTTWTGRPVSPFWLDMDHSINSSLGRQAQDYPLGFKPRRFIFEGDL